MIKIYEDSGRVVIDYDNNRKHFAPAGLVHIEANNQGTEFGTDDTISVFCSGVDGFGFKGVLLSLITDKDGNQFNAISDFNTYVLTFSAGDSYGGTISNKSIYATFADVIFPIKNKEFWVITDETKDSATSKYAAVGIANTATDLKIFATTINNY